MGRLDRMLRGVADDFEPDEIVIASCMGRESDGRRRRFVVLTDRRLFVGWARGSSRTMFARNQTQCTYGDGQLTLRDPYSEVTLRDVAAREGHTLTQLI